MPKKVRDFLSGGERKLSAVVLRSSLYKTGENGETENLTLAGVT